MSLEEAAQKVKISKKSLDDYLMQLRSAKKFGFNFEKHNNDKVGVIRSFVRKKKEEERKRIAQENKDRANSKTDQAAAQATFNTPLSPSCSQPQISKQGGKEESKTAQKTSKAGRKSLKGDFKSKS